MGVAPRAGESRPCSDHSCDLQTPGLLGVPGFQRRYLPENFGRCPTVVADAGRQWWVVVVVGG